METTTGRGASTAVTGALSSGECPAASASTPATGTGSPPGANVSGAPFPLGAGSGGITTPVFAALVFKANVKTLGALLEQFYEKRRLLILSAPNTSDPDYRLQNIMVQVRIPRRSWSTPSHLLTSSLTEVGLRVGPAARNADRAAGLSAPGDGSHQGDAAGARRH